MTVTQACEKLLAEVLRPRYLAARRPEGSNYPVAIYGKWHGNKYRLIVRFRSDQPDSTESEFEAPFARLEYVSRDRFDLSWHHYSGEWLCLCRSISLPEALRLIESDEHFQPC